MRTRYLSVILGCAAVAIGGCGSGGGGTTTGGPGLGKGAVNSQVFKGVVNQLCKQGNAALVKVRNDPAKQLEVVDEFLPKFQAVTASGDTEATYKQFVSNLEAEIAGLKSGNVAAARAAAAKNKALAVKLGVPACGA